MNSVLDQNTPRRRIPGPDIRRAGAARACVVCFASLVFLAGPLRAAPPEAGSLHARLDKILRGHGQESAVLGARVVDLSTGKTLYEHNAAEPLIPASNMKLVIMAAALDRLGPDCELPTILAIRDMDLVVVGGGDPAFGYETYADPSGKTAVAVFAEWIDRLKRQHVRQIPGDLIVDDSLFDQQFVHPNWPADQYQKWYEAPVGGLNLCANCVSVELIPGQSGRPAQARLIPDNDWLEIVNKTTSGRQNRAVLTRLPGRRTLQVSGPVAQTSKLAPVTVDDPGLYFGAALKKSLESAGISIHGDVVRKRLRMEDGRLPADCLLVAVHRARLSDVIVPAGKDSIGMVAESVLKLLGSRQSGLGTWESGRKAVEAYLTDLKIPAAQFVIDDGSGLSRKNRLSAAAATTILSSVYHSRDGRFEALRKSLAVAGADGTLDRRMRDPRIKGRVFAKTGYINRVRTLAGYIHTHGDRWLAFAFYYNDAVTAPLRKNQDDACRILVDWNPSGARTAQAPEVEK